MDERITGMMVYYYFVCKRKLWYFCHEIRMEANNEDVQLGKILDETANGDVTIENIENMIKKFV